MQIQKKWIVVIGIILVIGFVGVLFFTYPFFFAPSITCPKLKEYGEKHSRCGYLSSSNTSTNHWIAGFITEKKADRNNLFISFVTADSKGNTINEALMLPLPGMNAGLTVKRNSNSVQKEVTNLISAKLLFEELPKSSEVIITIPTPPKERIEDIKKKLGNNDFIRCYPYNEAFVKYLKNPTLLGRLSLLKNKFQTRCNLSIQLITIYQ